MKTQDVTKFLKDMVEISIFTLDDENYVIDNNEKRILISEDGKLSSTGMPLMVYQEEIKDTTAYVLNPSAEGLGQTPSSTWFYRMLQAALTSKMSVLCHNIVLSAIAAKKAAGKDSNKPDVEEAHLPMDVLNIAAKIIDDVDDKVLTELDSIFKSPEANDFLALYYQKKNLRYVVKSAIFEDEVAVPTTIKTFRGKFPHIRKKTWGVLERLLLGVLSIKTDEDLEKFGRRADDLTCPRLSSCLKTLLAIFVEINPLLGHINNGDYAIDLSLLAEHINKLGDYADNARWMVQSRQPDPVTQQNVIPGTVNIPGAAPSYTAQQNVQIPGVAYTQQAELAIPGYNAPNGNGNLAPVFTSGSNIPGPNYVPPFQPQGGLGYGQHPQFSNPMQSPGYGFQPPQQQMWQQPGQFNQQQYANRPPPWEHWPQQQQFGIPNMGGQTLIPGMPQGIYR